MSQVGQSGLLKSTLLIILIKSGQGLHSRVWNLECNSNGQVKFVGGSDHLQTAAFFSGRRLVRPVRPGSICVAHTQRQKEISIIHDEAL